MTSPIRVLVAVGGALHLMSLARELALQEFAEVALVVRHEHAQRARHAGRTTRKRLPRSGREATSMRPP